MRHIESRFRSLFFVMLATFAMFGVTVTLLGATVPKIVREFQWSYMETGIVMSAGSVGYFVFTFASGLLVRRIGLKPVVVVGLILQAIGLMFFAALPLVLLNVFLSFLIGVGHGCSEVVINLAVVRMERSGQSRLMNLMHATFCLGAIIGPFCAGLLIAAGSRWQMIYRVMASATLLMAGAFSLLPLSRVGEESEKSGDEPGASELLKHPLLILSFLILLLYVGAELGISDWMAEYYVKVFGTSASVGAYMVSVFWTGLLMGRLGLSFGYRGVRQAELLLVMAATCTGALIFAVLMKGPWLAGVGFFLAGLGYSGLYPVVMALVGEHFKRGQGVAVGFVATGGGIGAFAGRFLVAAIADRFGIRRGFFFCIVLNALMAVLAFGIIRQIRTIRRREAEDRAEGSLPP